MTPKNSITLLDGPTVQGLLKGHESDILNVVKKAYIDYGQQDSNLPHSTFLKFPDKPDNRIIGLPAYLGGSSNIAGMKWVASFPDNVSRGIDRASAVLILNDVQTGRPVAFLEASSINACRTAASAAIAAQHLVSNRPALTVSCIGCGYIGLETIKYLYNIFPNIEVVLLYDKAIERSTVFAKHLLKIIPSLDIRLASDTAEATANCNIVSFTTTADKPWIDDSTLFEADSTILHISLRDLNPNVILSCDNVVDDTSHVCRANTSVHLAANSVGNQNFINAEIGDVLNSGKKKYQRSDKPVIFSPFGLGILDIAVGKWLLDKSQFLNSGTRITNFFPEPWNKPTTAGLT
jgi:ornithine cyclodeaminase